MKRCQYCGRRGNAYMDRNRSGWYCRVELECFNRLIASVRGMASAGAAMATELERISQFPGFFIGADCILVWQRLVATWRVQQ